MTIGADLHRFAVTRPRTVFALTTLVTLLLGALIVNVKVDTDPENMLSEDEAVRIFHHETKIRFDLSDVVVLGVVNHTHPDGVFNPVTLGRIHELTEFARGLADPHDPKRRVITRNIVAPGTVDAIEQAGPGQVRFEWLMPTPPATREEALAVRDGAMGNPLLRGSLISGDGQALAIYLPVTQKDFSYEVRKQLLEKIAGFGDTGGGDEFHITGLPVAEDTFGVEMFIQMAVSAPLAMLMIFLLMLLFFRNMRLIVSPLIIALMTVVCTMGLLIGTGNTVHIMSSMIPIFLMPIAVVDSIHILSEFFDRYRQTRDRKETLHHVMSHLFVPMLYTSVTSSVGFASLALTPIPPVRVFGLFVAFGIMLAWVLTIILIPAYIMLMSEECLAGFGDTVADASGGGLNGAISRLLLKIGRFTHLRAGLIAFSALAVLGVAAWGITRIQINDNPVKWFRASHEIRVADRVLNSHFSGTYEAYLVLENDAPAISPAALADETLSHLQKAAGEYYPLAAAELPDLVAAAGREDFFPSLSAALERRMDAAGDDEAYDGWAALLDAVDARKNADQIFKRPDLLRWIAGLQKHLVATGMAGKSNSVADVVKKVHMELLEGKPEAFRIPDSVNAVAQTLISFQNSHKPDDLWHLVTPDYRHANIWVQLKNGDNQYMEHTIQGVERYIAANPPPVPLKARWAGLTYLNVVWQEKMVTGMLNSFLSSFVVVFLMMWFLFRSVKWGLLAMVPLTVTIALIYGIIGIIGKDYDMPVAVLSSLTLGLAVDFAIHFIERARESRKLTGSWETAANLMFEEPARAITRNVIVIAAGFTPLLLAPLVPYQTVGIFLASIMAISGAATMLLLPALISLLESWLFSRSAG
ncbi:MAG: RND transporter [Desulfobacterales bacterium]|nr:MAG: RND transporter [Desulfobacterales bacterium]